MTRLDILEVSATTILERLELYTATGLYMMDTLDNMKTLTENTKEYGENIFSANYMSIDYFEDTEPGNYWPYCVTMEALSVVLKGKFYHLICTTTIK